MPVVMGRDTTNDMVARPDGSGTMEDRRRSYRRPAGLRGRFTGGAGGGGTDAADVVVADLSSHGIGLVSAVPVEVGATRRVVIFREGTYDLRADVRIVSCRRHADGTYVVGAEIV